MRRYYFAAAMAAALTCSWGALSTPAFAALPTNYVVTKTADTGDGTCDADCSLREAIDAANADGTDSAITFASPLFDSAQTITLGGSQLSISADLTITGPGANKLAVSGNAVSRVLYVAGGTADISGLTIANGIHSFGGGLYNNASTVTLTDCAISGNTTSGTSANYGAGLFSNSGNMNLINCTISGNTASGGSTYNFGGGFYSNGGTASLINCTFSGNSASGGSYSRGGGFYSNGATASLNHCTISGNSANAGTNLEGGGVFHSGGTLYAINSIVAGNSASSAPDIFGSVSSLGHNLIGKTDGSSGWDGSDLTGTIATPLDAMLGTLQDNGGPTQTLALLVGSPAIDAGDASTPTTDQRGLGRVGTPDIGAFEVQLPPNTAPTVTTLPNFLKMDEDSTLALPASEFDKRFSDSDEDSLTKIRITALPVNGVLQLNNVNVTLNQEIVRGDLSTLFYVPNPNYYGSDAFEWNGSDGTVYAAQSAKVKILIASINDAPVLDTIPDQLTSPGNTLSFTATASDLDGHKFVYSLQDEPSGATITNAGKFTWLVPNLPSGMHNYTFTVRVTDKGNPALSDEQEVNVTVISGVFFSVTPTYDHGGAQLVFRLYNGTQRTMTNIGVNGNLRGTLGSLSPSAGSATTRLVNPSTGVRSLTWNGFTLAPGQEAQLVVNLTTVTPGQTIASDLRASYKLGGNRGDTRAPSIVYNNIPA